jgi:hypothetical protein
MIIEVMGNNVLNLYDGLGSSFSTKRCPRHSDKACDSSTTSECSFVAQSFHLITQNVDRLSHRISLRLPVYKHRISLGQSIVLVKTPSLRFMESCLMYNVPNVNGGARTSHISVSGS